MVESVRGRVGSRRRVPVYRTPVGEAPVVEAPAVEVPVVEAPAVEAPAVEAPTVEAPTVETTVDTHTVKVPVEAPTTKTPVETAVETPTVETPVKPLTVETTVVAPTVKAPTVEAPTVETNTINQPANRPTRIKANHNTDSNLDTPTTTLNINNPNNNDPNNNPNDTPQKTRQPQPKQPTPNKHKANNITRNPEQPPTPTNNENKNKVKPPPPPKKHAPHKTKATHPTQAILGIDTDGQIQTLTVAEAPHLMICGETGSGKSVFLNAMILSMMSHTTPYDLRISGIDPKKVEFMPYKNNSFWPIDPITDMTDASAFISYMVEEMERRYDIIAATGARNIGEYNEWAEKNDSEHLPYWLTIIDEYADLMDQDKTVETDITRLGQKARACGVHLIIATQRPSVSVISPTLRANVPVAIGMSVRDASNSHIIIGDGGCEMLTTGQALVKGKDKSITKVQGPYVSNEEFEKILASINERYGDSEDIDFKTILVEAGLYGWADEQAGEGKPGRDRPVKKMGRRL